MGKSRVFFIILVAFIVGVFARSFFELGNNLYFFLLIFSLIFLAVFYKNKKIIVVFFVLLFFIFGAWLTGSKIEETQNLPYAGKAIQTKAVVQKASRGTFGQNIIVRDDQKKNILVQVPKYPEYNYGDLLDINCILKPIENRDADFDYKMYMAKDGVLYQCDPIKSPTSRGAEQFNGVNPVKSSEAGAKLSNWVKTQKIKIFSINSVADLIKILTA